MDIFKDDPVITVSLKHCFIEASLTLRVQADSYPLTVRPDQESTELMRETFCKAVEMSVRDVAKAVAESHDVFESAFHEAVARSGRVQS